MKVLHERACHHHRHHHLLLRLHFLPLHAIGITPHFPSPFQVTDPSPKTILHKRHLPVVHQTMALNHNHPPVNQNQLFHLQPCCLPSPMFPVLITTLQPPRLRVMALLKVIFRAVMQLSGLQVNRAV